MLGNDEGVWPFVDLTMKIIDSHMSNEEGVVLSSTAAATKKKKARVYVAEIRGADYYIHGWTSLLAHDVAQTFSCLLIVYRNISVECKYDSAS